MEKTSTKFEISDELIKKENLPFQFISSIAMGLFFGAFASSIFFTFMFVVIFEIICFTWKTFDRMDEYILERIFINLIFFIGWVISRKLYLNESGFEPLIDNINICYDLKYNKRQKI